MRKKLRTGFTAWFFTADEGDGMYIAKLREWIDQAPAELSFSRKFKWLLCWMVDALNGQPLRPTNAAVVDVSAVTAQVRDQLREEFRAELRDWVRDLIGDADRVQQVNALHAAGGDVDDDMLKNMLDDWENGKE